MLTRLAIVLFLVVSNTVLGEADGPDYWQVTHVRAGSGLNLRAGPSLQHDVLDVLPHDTVMLENLGCTPEYTTAQWVEFTPEQIADALRSRWCQVRYRSLIGWVYAYYLTEY